MAYDYVQVRRDIKLVTRAFGDRVPIGFFTEAVFESGPFKLKDGEGKQTLSYKGKEVDLRNLEPTLGIGKWLITRAIKAEEVTDSSTLFFMKFLQYDERHDVLLERW